MATTKKAEAAYHKPGASRILQTVGPAKVCDACKFLTMSNDEDLTVYRYACTAQGDQPEIKNYSIGELGRDPFPTILTPASCPLDRKSS
jgi:hypothetical protein